MTLKRLLSAVVLCAVPAAALALPSSSGGSGLLVGRTAEIVPPQGFDFSPFIQFTQQSIPQSAAYPITNRTQFTAEGTLDYGLTDSMELGLLVPYSSDQVQFTRTDPSLNITTTSVSSAALSDLQGILKYQVLHNVNPSPRASIRTVDFSVAAYGGVSPKDPQGIIGSGGGIFGIEAATTLFLGKDVGFAGGRRASTGLHASLGYEGSDYYNYTDPTLGVQSKPKVKGTAGVDYLPVYFLDLSFELVGTAVMGIPKAPAEMLPGDEDLFAMAGVRLVPAKNFALSLGGGVGIPGGLQANTGLEVVAGASFLFGEAPAGTRAIPRAVVKRSLREMRVDVLDGCPMPGLAQNLAKAMTAKGFNVVRVARSTRTGYQATAIIAPDLYLPEARKLAQAVPGQKRLYRIRQPYPDVDIRVLAGCLAGAGAVPILPGGGALPQPVAKKSIKELKIEVLNGCGLKGLEEDIGRTLLLGGYNVTAIGKAERTGYVDTAIITTDLYIPEARTISTKIRGGKKLYRARVARPSGDLTVIVGCAASNLPAAPAPAPPPAAPPPAPAVAAPPPVAPPAAAPSAPKKALADLKVEVLNGCGKAGAANDVARNLLLGGLNVTRVANAVGHYNESVVAAPQGYEEEAAKIAQTTQKKAVKVVKEPNPHVDVDVTVFVGCAP